MKIVNTRILVKLLLRLSSGSWASLSLNTIAQAVENRRLAAPNVHVLALVHGYRLVLAQILSDYLIAWKLVALWQQLWILVIWVESLQTEILGQELTSLIIWGDRLVAINTLLLEHALLAKRWLVLLLLLSKLVMDWLGTHRTVGLIKYTASLTLFGLTESTCLSSHSQMALSWLVCRIYIIVFGHAEIGTPDLNRWTSGLPGYDRASCRHLDVCALIVAHDLVVVVPVYACLCLGVLRCSLCLWIYTRICLHKFSICVTVTTIWTLRLLNPVFRGHNFAPSYHLRWSHISLRTYDHSVVTNFCLVDWNSVWLGLCGGDWS